MIPRLYLHLGFQVELNGINYSERAYGTYIGKMATRKYEYMANQSSSGGFVLLRRHIAAFPLLEELIVDQLPQD